MTTPMPLWRPLRCLAPFACLCGIVASQLHVPPLPQAIRRLDVAGAKYGAAVKAHFGESAKAEF